MSTDTTFADDKPAYTKDRPQKRFIKGPDDKVHKAKIAALHDEIKKLNLTNDELNAQIEKVVSDPKVIAKRTELQKELKELITKQGTIKVERTTIMDQIKLVDQQLKRKINEIQAQTSKSNFKSVAEIDSRINHLDLIIDEGSLKLADERRYVKEMSQLRKLKKDFGSIDKIQELIEADKEKIAELKKKLNAIGNKEIQARFEAIQKELDQLNADNKSISEKRQSLFDQRNKLRKTKDEKYSEIKKLRSDLDAEFTKFKAAMAAEKKKRDEEYKARQLEEKTAKRKEVAEKELSAASIPAFSREIDSLQVLLAYFDPSYVKPPSKNFEAIQKSTSSTAFQADSKPRAAGRVIEMPDDLVVLKKEEEIFHTGSKGKKAARAKKAQKPKNFTVESDVIVALGELSIPLPTKQDDVPSTIETLKETLTALEGKQEEQTKLNIERAKAKIAKLEAEEDAADKEAEEAKEEPAEEKKEEAAVEGEEKSVDEE